MDFKVNREALSVNEGVYDGVSEQAIELDCILPDYYPDIFKVLKCQLTPTVVSYNTSSDKLTYDAVVLVRVLYITEQGNAVKSIEQRYAYSKTLDFSKSCDNPIVNIRPKVDYVNCRAVNQRRLDIRGAVSCKVKATASRQQQLISDAQGMGIQVKKEMLSYGGQRLHAYKQFTVREEIDIGSGKPEAQSILRYDAAAQLSDYKVIANKIIAKGNAAITMLYAHSENNENGEGGMETVQIMLPISQILDVDGVTDSFECFVTLHVISTELSVKQNEEGENKLLSCEMVLGCSCVAHKAESLQLVTDLYSTGYICDFTMATIKTERMPRIINESFLHKSSVESGDGALECVYDVWCTISNPTCRYKEPNAMVVSGSLNICVLAKSENSCTICLERSDIFDHVIEIEGLSEDSVFDPDVRVQSVAFSLASTNAVEVRAEISVRGCLYETQSCAAVCEIDVDAAKPKEKEALYALKLYYADKGEGVWDIAKRYSTSVEAIMEENELAKDVLEQRGMLLIPMV